MILNKLNMRKAKVLIVKKIVCELYYTKKQIKNAVYRKQHIYLLTENSKHS